MEQISRKKSIFNFFLGKMMFLNNSHPMNPMVPSDLRDFFPCKNYGHLMDSSTPVDLGYDVLDLGYDVIDKAKRIRGKRSRQISRKIF
jgi:hypothetical protein